MNRTTNKTAGRTKDPVEELDWASRAASTFSPYYEVKALPASICNCSTSGPRAHDGKKVSPPTIRITAIKVTAKSGVAVLKVPLVSGTGRLAASDPATARSGIKGR